MQIAIAKNDNKVSLWCDVERTDLDGTIHFFVLNGCWDGWIKDDIVHVVRAGKSYPNNRIVWNGKAPMNNYNEAIEWIQSKVDSSGGRVRDFLYIEPTQHIDDEIPF